MESFCTFLERTCFGLSVQTKKLSPTILENSFAIPSNLLQEGFDHIGDIATTEDYIIAPVEKRNYEPPSFLAYRKSNLSIDFISPITPQKHAPWVAIDMNNGIAYSSEFDNVTYLYSYNASSHFSFMERIALQGYSNAGGLMNVQGGDVHGKYLFLSTNSGQNPEGNVFIVSLETFAIVATFNIDLFGGEMEGVTVIEDSDSGISLGFVSNTAVGVVSRVYWLRCKP
mmetsp:Transcript_20629/g.53046  ORF Transcript_20629/g.53046 Transcript_20629/m.53046 type:complete len:227 (-) Transcript_20629:765-1445(-)